MGVSHGTYEKKVGWISGAHPPSHQTSLYQECPQLGFHDHWHRAFGIVLLSIGSHPKGYP